MGCSSKLLKFRAPCTDPINARKFEIKFINGKRIRLVVGTIALSAMLQFGAGAALAAGPDEFIRDMARRAIDSLAGQEISIAERERRFRDVIRRAFDMPTVARFALGRHWRTATNKERHEYVGLFEDYIVKMYSVRFRVRSGSGKNFRVGKVLVINKLDTLVLSEIVRPIGRPIKINWRVRGNDDYRIVDVIVEGISMGITQRDEFASVIRSTGGKVEGLLAALRKKTREKLLLSPGSRALIRR